MTTPPTPDAVALVDEYFDARTKLTGWRIAASTPAGMLF
jgi:hypothetical protein